MIVTRFWGLFACKGRLRVLFFRVFSLVFLILFFINVWPFLHLVLMMRMLLMRMMNDEMTKMTFLVTILSF